MSLSKFFEEYTSFRLKTKRVVLGPSSGIRNLFRFVFLCPWGCAGFNCRASSLTSEKALIVCGWEENVYSQWSSLEVEWSC